MFASLFTLKEYAIILLYTPNCIRKRIKNANFHTSKFTGFESLPDNKDILMVLYISLRMKSELYFSFDRNTLAVVDI